MPNTDTVYILFSFDQRHTTLTNKTRYIWSGWIYLSNQLISEVMRMKRLTYNKLCFNKI